MIILHLSEVHHQLQMMRQGGISIHIIPYLGFCGGMKIQLLISDFWIFWICNAFGICTFGFPRPVTLMLGSKPCSAKAQRLYISGHTAPRMWKNMWREMCLWMIFGCLWVVYFPSVLPGFDPFRSDWCEKTKSISETDKMLETRFQLIFGW